MKVKIKKREQNEYLLTTEKYCFVINITLSSKELIIIISQTDLNGNLLSAYKSNFSLFDFCKAHKIFRAFNSIQDVYKGLLAHLDTEYFGVKTQDEKIELSLYVLGQTISLFIPSQAQLFPEEKTEDKEESVLRMFDEDANQFSQFLLQFNLNTKLKLYNNFVCILKERAEEEKSKGEDPLVAPIKIIQEHRLWILCLCMISDGRFCSCSGDGAIKVFSSENYQCQMTITEHEDPVTHISALENGGLVSCSHDRTIRVWKIMEAEYQHIKTIRVQSLIIYFKVIGLSGSRIGVCSDDGEIRIFDESYECIQILGGDDPDPNPDFDPYPDPVHSIIELRNKKYIVSGTEKGKICFWGNESYKCEKVIEGIKYVTQNNLIEIDNERLVVGGFDQLVIIDLAQQQLIKTIKLGLGKKIFCIMQSGEGCIHCGLDGSLVKFNANNYQILSYRKNCHKSNVYGLLKLDDYSFASCSEDHLIKIWKL